MREYRAKRKAERQDRAGPDQSATTRPELAGLESPDAAWRQLPPVAALVALARALLDLEPDGGADILPPRPGALVTAGARWRTFAPRVAFVVLSGALAASCADAPDQKASFP